MNNISPIPPDTRALPPQARVYRGSRYWDFNVHGAVVAGLGGAILMVVIGIIMFWVAAARLEALLFLLLFVANLVGGFLAFYIGNLVASFPYAVEVNPGSGLRLLAPYKEIYIHLDEIENIGESFLYQGFVVRLRRRRGLLKYFVVHWLFGHERKALIQAIQQAVQHRENS